jgi:competence protein ComEA
MDDMDLLGRRRDALLALIALLVVLVLAGRLLVHAGVPHAARVTPPPIAAASSGAGAAPGAVPAAAAVVVDVVGAVRRPGLYRLRDGERIADAVARAGGATRKADLEQVNLAAPVADGEQVVVPRRTPRGAGAPAGVAAPAGPVHLSTATVEQLDALPGVGPVTAQKIVAYRQEHGAFRSVDELDAIPGIGPARLDQLRGLVAP